MDRMEHTGPMVGLGAETQSLPPLSAERSLQQILCSVFLNAYIQVVEEGSN